MKLLKYLIIIPLITLQVNHSHAQQFKGGLLFGITGCQIDGDNFGGYNKPGITAGMFVKREVSYKWGYQAELKYIMKGAAKITTGTDPTVYKKTLHYLEIPVLAMYRISNVTGVETGLAAAYMGYASLNFGNGIENATSTVKRYDINYIAAVSYIYSEKVTFNLKFCYSIVPISRLPGNLTFWGTYGQYNHILALAVYYTIK
jgi:hypothetical protein